MKTEFLDDPRIFTVKELEIHDYGKIQLEPQEMVSFQTPSGRECDFTATSWGFYLGSSLNSRLKREGFKTALVVNEYNKLHVNAIEIDKIEEFQTYLKENKSKIICWLDEWFGEE
jgi:hypothetical protein